MSQQENALNDLLGKITSKFRSKLGNSVIAKPQDPGDLDPSIQAVREYRQAVENGEFDLKAHPLWEMNLIN